MTVDSRSLALDSQLCFSLQAAARAIVAAYRPGLDALGLTYSQYTVMLVLWEHGPVAMGFLAGELHTDSGTLSPMLKRLELQGLVTRRRRPEDERVLLVTPTDDGEALREPARIVQRRVADATGLAPEALAGLRTELNALAGRLREAQGLLEAASTAE